MTDHTSPVPPAEGQPWTLFVGDTCSVLAGMPGQSANCIVTSPPYWGKRDYGVPGQYGHEDTRPPTSPPCARSSARRGGCSPMTGRAG
jgi:hypothetical protein